MFHDKNIMKGTIPIFLTINLKHFIIFFLPISIFRPKRLDKDKGKYVQMIRVHKSRTYSKERWRKVS